MVRALLLPASENEGHLGLVIVFSYGRGTHFLHFGGEFKVHRCEQDLARVVIIISLQKTKFFINFFIEFVYIEPLYVHIMFIFFHITF